MTNEKKHKLRKALFARFSALGITDSREHVVFNFTHGRTTSTRELEPWEMAELIEKLGGPKIKDSDDYKWGMFDECNRQHRYILSLCYQYNWTTWSRKLGKQIADIERLGRWLKHYSAVKKPLAMQTGKELQRTVFQLEQMVVKQYN